MTIIQSEEICFTSWKPPDVPRPDLARTKLVEGIFKESLIYPEDACKEALVNAVAHRDYSIEGKVLKYSYSMTGWRSRAGGGGGSQITRRSQVGKKNPPIAQRLLSPGDPGGSVFRFLLRVFAMSRFYHPAGAAASGIVRGSGSVPHITSSCHAAGVVMGERNLSSSSKRSRRSSMAKLRHNDRGNVLGHNGGMNRARASFQNVLWTKRPNHHCRQRSRVRRSILTPTPRESARPAPA